MRGMKMNQINLRPEWLQTRKRVSFTTVDGFRPMLEETILEGWVAKCKIEGKNQTQLANELVEKCTLKDKRTMNSLVHLIKMYVKGQIKL
jgi:hypothetical protein